MRPGSIHPEPTLATFERVSSARSVSADRAPPSKALSATKAGSWTFGDGLAPIFDDHVRRSVPGYLELHRRCLSVLGETLRPGDLVYDLGCSTGVFTAQLARLVPGVRVIGLDNEEEMIEEAKRRAPGLEFVCRSASNAELAPSRAILSLYVLQFLPLQERVHTLAQIHKSLVPGGIFIWAEKVRFTSSVEQAHMDQAYRSFKLQHGFSEAEIDAKAKALEGVLVPLTSAENVGLLRDAGFTSVEPLFCELCFEAWIATA